MRPISESDQGTLWSWASNSHFEIDYRAKRDDNRKIDNFLSTYSKVTSSDKVPLWVLFKTPQIFRLPANVLACCSAALGAAVALTAANAISNNLMVLNLYCSKGCFFTWKNVKNLYYKNKIIKVLVPLFRWLHAYAVVCFK